MIVLCNKSDSKNTQGGFLKWLRKNLNVISRIVNIGTIGHVDHGKTTLTAAITKVLAHDWRC